MQKIKAGRGVPNRLSRKCIRPKLLLGEILFDRGRYTIALRSVLRAEPSNDLTGSIDQEFIKIPADVAGKFRIRILVCQESV